MPTAGCCLEDGDEDIVQWAGLADLHSEYAVDSSGADKGMFSVSKPDSVFSSSTAEIPPCPLLASMWEVNMSKVPLTPAVLVPVAKEEEPWASAPRA